MSELGHRWRGRRCIAAHLVGRAGRRLLTKTEPRGTSGVLDIQCREAGARSKSREHEAHRLQALLPRPAPPDPGIDIACRPPEKGLWCWLRRLLTPPTHREFARVARHTTFPRVITLH